MAAAIAAILAPALLSQALEDQTPACVFAMPARPIVATCLDRALPQLHAQPEQAVAGTATSAEMPPGAQLYDSVPAVRYRQPVDLCPNLTLQLAASACPDKGPTQLHDDPLTRARRIELAIMNPTVGAANTIRQIMATPAQFPAAYNEEAFNWPQRGNLLLTTPDNTDLMFRQPTAG